MQIEELQEKLAEYVDLITKIRIMSAVLVDEESGPDEYSRKLRNDYKEIGNLGVLCREILDDTLYPILNSKEHIEKNILHVLQDFCNMLLEPASGEELDLFLLFEISDRLLKEFEYIKDIEGYAIQLNIHISVCYANVNKTARITISRELTSFYRDEGLKAAKSACELVYNKERFLELSNEARHSVMRGVQFYSALYDTFFSEPDTNQQRYQALINALSLYDNSFYWINMANYNWEYHRIRCLEHMGQLTERGNRWKFSKQQCEEICEWLEQLTIIWNENPGQASKIIPEAHYQLILLRNAYYAEKLTKKEYQKSLLELYDKWSNDKYDMHSVQINLLIPAEYLTTLKGERISIRTEILLRNMYNRIIDYVLNSVNMDAFNFLQEYLIGFLEEFIEIPGVISFEDMGLNCLAAIHPPTYVHSMQVADISKCLASHLVYKNPRLFLEEFGLETEEQVYENYARITQYVYHCGLCHDFGKLTMIDSIFIYGRNLLDSEFEVIKKHSSMGAYLLSRFDSTKEYVDVAKQHHIWYNQKGGYPVVEGEIARQLVSNIVEVADCIDAATDTIGRSYNKGKRFEEICKELEAESGTRYAPYVVELLKDEDVLEDISYLLVEGRQNNYQNTYLLLTRVKDCIYR